jgi:hypothetical protein
VRGVGSLVSDRMRLRIDGMVRQLMDRRGYIGCLEDA